MSEEQGTNDWFEKRKGKVTASRIYDLMSKTKSGYSTSRIKYMAQLMAERITDLVTAKYTTVYMQHGIDQEKFARAAYEIKTGYLVDTIDFVEHPYIEMCGASPDGLIGEDGLCEIKCPDTIQMIDTLLTNKVPENYLLQMQFQLACTQRKWCDYVVFDPRMPENVQLSIKRIERDDKLISDIEYEVKLFLEELSNKIKQFKNLKQEDLWQK